MKIHPRLESDRQLSAFTLVELLAVVVIIATLAALVIPSVRTVIERGGQVKCTNNLRQLSAAYLMNAGDNGGNLLGGYRDGSAWTQILKEQGYFTFVNTPDSAMTQWRGCNFCPGEKVHHGWGDYGPNSGLNQHRLSQVKKPSAKVMICEARTPALPAQQEKYGTEWRGTFNFNPPGLNGWLSSMPAWPFRHGNVILMSFFDGHVEARTRASLEPVSERFELFGDIFSTAW